MVLTVIVVKEISIMVRIAQNLAKIVQKEYVISKMEFALKKGNVLNKDILVTIAKKNVPKLVPTVIDAIKQLEYAIIVLI